MSRSIAHPTIGATPYLGIVNLLEDRGAEVRGCPYRIPRDGPPHSGRRYLSVSGESPAAMKPDGVG